MPICCRVVDKIPSSRSFRSISTCCSRHLFQSCCLPSVCHALYPAFSYPTQSPPTRSDIVICGVVDTPPKNWLRYSPLRLRNRCRFYYAYSTWWQHCQCDAFVRVATNSRWLTIVLVMDLSSCSEESPNVSVSTVYLCYVDLSSSRTTVLNPVYGL